LPAYADTFLYRGQERERERERSNQAVTYFAHAEVIKKISGRQTVLTVLAISALSHTENKNKILYMLNLKFLCYG
jgi:hypothetical protein